LDGYCISTRESLCAYTVVSRSAKVHLLTEYTRSGERVAAGRCFFSSSLVESTSDNSAGGKSESAFKIPTVLKPSFLVGYKSRMMFACAERSGPDVGYR